MPSTRHRPLPVDLPRYAAGHTYDWNYQHAPEPVDVDVPEWPEPITFCGMAVASPLGIPAGPLLNGKWVLYYASLGFDVLTYKTVRSRRRACYPMPNLQPVVTGMLDGTEDRLPVAGAMQGSWAVSFGMPSQPPDVWRADIEATRDKLPPGKVLSVSVVGSIQPGWGMEELAADYAACARWAVESGAHCIETNFSCPNVATCDGQLFQQPEAAAQVAREVKSAIGDVPLILKIGHVHDAEQAEALITAVAPFTAAFAMTNSIAARVEVPDGTIMFDGERRGICGEATREASLGQTRLFRRLLDNSPHEMELIGVGGAGTAAHVREYLDAGAQAVHLATAAMVDPLVALLIKRQVAAGG